MTTPVEVRQARPTDAATLVEIEAAADALLIDRFGATDWPPPASAEERSALPGFILVAEQRDHAAGSPAVIGFVHVLEIDGHAHLEQLSVLPESGRRGIGRRLVAEALRTARTRGHTQITLRTYRDVPWNAPFYASCGFVETSPDSPFLADLVRVETELGLFRHGARVQMTALL